MCEVVTYWYDVNMIYSNCHFNFHSYVDTEFKTLHLNLTSSKNVPASFSSSSSSSIVTTTPNVSQGKWTIVVVM